MLSRYFVFTAKVALLFLLFTMLGSAQDARPVPKTAQPRASDSSADSSSQKPSQEWSGMYAFLKEGEFVQLTVEDDGHVTGFVSRYGDGESDKGAFLDQFFKSARIDGGKLIFVTEVVHGVCFDFKGVVERGAGKNPGDEAYYVLKGRLTETRTDAGKQVTANGHEVLLKMFPQESVAGPTQPNPSPRN
ncbi:MAG: hypothetical protein WB729_00940 [Candidatus Sulfotelmatobacter sp.]